MRRMGLRILGVQGLGLRVYGLGFRALRVSVEGLQKKDRV